MRQNAIHKLPRELRDLLFALRIPEQILRALRDRHIGVHAAPVDADDWLGKEARRHSHLGCDGAADQLVELDLVGSRHHFAVSIVDLELRRCNLRMVLLILEAQRALGFQNEKDHPEVAPSQFEINYGYGEVVAAADQIQLYKLICRTVASQMGMTASFLPKPIVGVNGSGMHTTVSISENGKNLFWDAKGEEKLSKMGWAFVDRILTHGNDICLLLNPSVNAYRRLDPHFEAPNQIKASAVDRGSMIRIPIGNEKSMRVEVRSVSPDANPYLVMLTVFKT